MADPVKGSDVLLQIYKSGQYCDFICATDISIEFKTDLQSVKTIGDGYWQRYRTQSLGYTIKLSGLVNINANEPTAWDMLDYEMNMTEFQYRMTFTDNTGSLKAIFGYGTIESSVLSGGVDGFAKGEFTIFGNGSISISDSAVACNVSVTNITLGYVSESYINAYITTSGSGTLDHLEYTFGGGSRLSSNSSVIQLTNPPLNGASQVLVVYPICGGGYEGTSGTLTISHVSQPV